MKKQRLWATLHPFFEHGDIMGRSVANEGFITAFLQHSPYDGCHFFLADEKQAAFVRRRLEEAFPHEARRGVFRVTTRHELPEAVAANDYEVFHLSDCVADSAALCRFRNALSRNIFAVTGTTHSLSYPRYPLSFFDQIWPGATQRDAVIATSAAGENAMRAMFAALRAGCALPDSFVAPRLERIPLGVSPDDFTPPENRAEEGAAARQKLGVPADHLVLLVFARISHYSKMDVLPIFRALVRAETQGLPKGGYTLILSGWVDAGSEPAEAYAAIAKRLGISFTLVPSPDNALRKALFAGADMFLSPVDNPQETFGLTMLEAGAASLPVVASDFDGYRDLVTHGETGFLAPTLGPGTTFETDALSGVLFDNQHHLRLAQQSVVSVPHLAEHIAALARDPGMRRRFGETARERVLAHYTWKHVAQRHVALWEELAATPVERPGAAHPLHPAYPEIFGGYYSRILDEAAASSMMVQWTAFGEAVYRGLDFPAVYAGVERMVSMDALRKMLFSARRAVTAKRLLSDSGDPAEAERAAFLVLWALKHDLLEQTRPGS